jgi:ribosomal protein S18 acetylase RimI-like enzyme
MDSKTLEFKRLVLAMEEELAVFFRQIVADGDDQMFHPHAFDQKTASDIVQGAGKDQYVVATLDGKIVAYGMLRGWDEGYEIPSLGMIISKSLRGMGVGFAFIGYLHAVARICGAATIRLSVYESNEKAIRLYEKVGYSFCSKGDGTLIGKWSPDRQ